MKIILITGARSGIALSVINSIKNKDYYIYATTHTEKEAESLRERFKNYDNIECFKLDVTNDQDLEQLDNLDIDILLSNAAISYGGNLTELDINKIKDNYEVNVFSNLRLIQKIIKKNIDGECKIIIMSSLAGIIPIKFIGSYTSTKASLIKIAETLKNELKLINKNIHIVLIEPGIYLTGFNKYMFMNKHDDSNSIYSSLTEQIELEENLMLEILGHKDLSSITKKIVKAIESNNPKFIYRAPISQVIGVKLYALFKE